MTIRQTASLAVKYLARYRRRYVFLFSALSFGFCTAAVITALKTGISENLYTAAQEHYTGDIIFLGNERDSPHSKHLDGAARKAVFETLRETDIPFSHYAERTLRNDDGLLYFNGESVNLRYLNGVDWEAERAYFKKLHYVSGSGADIHGGNHDGIIISEQVMTILGARKGDSVTLEISDRYEQKNTWVFVVEAVVKDSSVFGLYKAYISRKTMNYLLGFEPEDSSSIGIFLKDRRRAEYDKVILRDALAQKTAAAPVMRDRNEFDREWRQDAEGIRVFVITIPVYLTELYQLIDAISLLNVFLYLMMLLIVFASAAVTWRLILHERTKEIGTMRALGFTEKSVRRVLVMETVILGALAVIAGICAAVILGGVFARLRFPTPPGFGILLSDGSLTLTLQPLALIPQIVALYIMLFIAVIMPVNKLLRRPLVETLAGGMKG